MSNIVIPTDEDAGMDMYPTVGLRQVESSGKLYLQQLYRSDSRGMAIDVYEQWRYVPIFLVDNPS